MLGNRRLALVFLVLSLLLAPLCAHAQIEGKYVGLYQFYSMSNLPAELVLEKTRKGFEGEVTFSHFEHGVGNAMVRSSFAMTAAYDSALKTVRFNFVSWIDPPEFGDYEAGIRKGKLETNGQVLSGEGFEFALEGTPESERMMRKRDVFLSQALVQRRIDDDSKKKSGRYERVLESEIAAAAARAAETAEGSRRRRGN